MVSQQQTQMAQKDILKKQLKPLSWFTVKNGKKISESFSVDKVDYSYAENVLLEMTTTSCKQL